MVHYSYYYIIITNPWHKLQSPLTFESATVYVNVYAKKCDNKMQRLSTYCSVTSHMAQG